MRDMISSKTIPPQNKWGKTLMLPAACPRANYSTFSANEKLGTANEKLGNTEIGPGLRGCHNDVTYLRSLRSFEVPLRKRKNTQTCHVFEGKNITGIDNCCPWAYFTAEKKFKKIRKCGILTIFEISQFSALYSRFREIERFARKIFYISM